MSESILFELSVAFATLTGTAGFVLGILAWRRFQGAPFGTDLAIIVGFCAGITVYHAVLLIAPELSGAVELVETVAFLLLLAFVWSTIRKHRRMSAQPETGLQS